MPKLPVVSGKKLYNLLIKAGFAEIRRRGSHVFIESENGKLRTVIPIHGNEDLGRGLLKKILTDLELEVADLLKMLKE
ncbi:type II toxin-antitoxin system HicA family toxin [Candidatus Peregrinibacteria bacterium]|nr:type II toxin-antitoxin system HicA family toxin [Candidatus Peregrinibacteria bacterium]